MKLLATGRVVLQKLTWFELRTVLGSKIVHHTNIFVSSDLVNVSEGTAAERSKPGAKDQSHITNDGILDDFVFEAFRSFVDES